MDDKLDRISELAYRKGQLTKQADDLIKLGRLIIATGIRPDDMSLFWRTCLHIDNELAGISIELDKLMEQAK